ncbi:MAG: four helix bundle protein [Cyanobacteria bacterium P01_G01_bin.39]
MCSEISIQERTKQFAVRIIFAYTEIVHKSNYDDAVRVLAKQLLRSGTSIGANCKEAISAQSKKDFIHKYEIALKEASGGQHFEETSKLRPQKLNTGLKS